MENKRKYINDIQKMLGGQSASENGTEVKCPVCGYVYVHEGTPGTILGEDNYKARPDRCRGNVVVIPFYGECDHQWHLCFGFHKGSITAWIEIAPEPEF